MAQLLLLSALACFPAHASQRSARAASPASAALPAYPVEGLRPGVPATPTVTTSLPLRYRFSAAPGSVFRLDLDQRDLKLNVAVLRPDGAALLQQSLPIHAATSIVATANLAGVYTVTVSPDESDGRPRQVSISLADIGPSNPRRALELSAGAALEAADSLASQWSQEAIDRAIVQYGVAADTWLRAADKQQAASAFLRQGDLHTIRGQYKLAMASYAQGLRAASSPALASLKADLLNAMAAAAVSVTDEPEVEKDAQTALALSQSIAYADGRGRAFTSMAHVEFFRSNMKAAQLDLDQAMAIWARTPDRAGEALSHIVASYLASASDAYAEDLEHLTTARRLLRCTDDRYDEALMSNDIGNYYLHMDELEKARDSYNAALHLSTQMGSTIVQANALDDFGFYLESVGDPTAARLYERAESIMRNADYGIGYGVILSDLSRAYAAEGKAKLAMQYGESELRIASDLHDEILISLALRDIGEADMAAGDIAAALKLFTQAIDPRLIAPHSANRARAGIEIGRALERLGRTSEALDAYRQSAALSHQLALAHPEAEARYRLANLLAAQGQLEAALAEIEQAIPLVEKLRAKVSADDTRTLWFASFHSIYTLDIDLLMQQALPMRQAAPHPDQARRAFQMAEQSIARSFVDLLRDAEIDKGRNQALQAEDASVRRLIAADTEKESALLTARRESAALRAVSSEIADLHARSLEIEARLKAEDPDYFQMQVNPLTVDQVQAQLDDDDLVLEYSLGPSRSYLWAIGKGSFTGYQLPAESRIEPLVRRFRQALVAPNPTLQRYLETGGPAVSQQDEPALAAELGHMLLSPVAELDRYKRIIVVADGTLQYLPFGVLATGSPASPGEAPRIADSHEVVNLPSMTALSVLRHNAHANGTATKGLVVFADPVFEADDPRIAAASPAHGLPSSSPAGASRSKSSAGAHAAAGRSRAPSDLGLPRLPGTRHEAELIAAAAPPATASVLLGFDASRARASSPEIGTYAVIHFATHSLFDDQHPESSGVILSLFNRDGTPQDGTLRLRDIYDLKLSANLVVLSACDTALGKDIKGEGIVGLTRGFMYAGAPRVVATLWRVDDDVTSEFMKDFYQAIYQQGAAPAAALRQAQQQMRTQPRFHSPYYWGAFVIEGEWLPLDKEAGPTAKFTR